MLTIISGGLSNNTAESKKRLKGSLPSDDNETVEAVPRVVKVRVFPVQSHGDDLDNHFCSKEGKNEVVELLQNLTPSGGAFQVATGLVHPQGDAVQEDNGHADPLKPRDRSLRRTPKQSKTYIYVTAVPMS